jgi:hypothetical protein
MPNIRTLAAVLALAAADIPDARLCAQTVLLSEIVAGANGWIELHNRGSAPADLSTWSIFLATATPGWPQTYWWAFPAGTAIAPGGYLVVHWYQRAPSVPVPGELWTGNTVYDFLFGPGGEPLPAGGGALALLNTQQSATMNAPAAYVDYVAYGRSGFPGEAFAVQAGRWTAARAVAAPGGAQSLARNPNLVGAVAPELQWMLDATPTPGGSNVGAAAVNALGAPCAVFGHHLLGAPGLRAVSTPLLGNPAFALQVTNTTGAYLEHCIVAYAAATATGLPSPLPPATGGGCPLLIDYRAPLGAVWMHTATSVTDIPLPVPAGNASLAGASFAVQAIVFDLWPAAWPPYEGATNALAVTLGN